MAPPKARPVDLKEIDLPPQQIREEMVADADQAATIDQKKADRDQKPAAIAQLDFVAPDQFTTTVPLKHPFKLDGKEVREVIVRRLRTGEVAQLVASSLDGGFSNYEAYAFMTGLTAEQVRGLMDEDGEAVTDACFDFLPQILVGAEDAPTD